MYSQWTTDVDLTIRLVFTAMDAILFPDNTAFGKTLQMWVFGIYPADTQQPVVWKCWSLANHWGICSQILKWVSRVDAWACRDCMFSVLVSGEAALLSWKSHRPYLLVLFKNCKALKRPISLTFRILFSRKRPREGHFPLIFRHTK